MPDEEGDKTKKCPDSCPKNQYCNKTTNYQCVPKEDEATDKCPESCPENQHCDETTNYQCVPDNEEPPSQCPETCPEEEYCDETTNYQCVPIGWEPPTNVCPDCPENFYCNESTNWECVENTPQAECIAESKQCLGNILQICNASGQYENAQDCSLDQQTCKDGENGIGCYLEQTCTVGHTKCEDNIIYQCSESGTYAPKQDCSSLKDTPVCNDTSGTAVCECIPGTRLCDGKTVKICTDAHIFEVEQKCGDFSTCAIELDHPRCIVERTLRVLILEIDPILTTGKVEGKDCTGITASQCLGQNKDQAVNELIEDIEFSSHNTVKVQIVGTEKTNEFAYYNTQVPLVSGGKSNHYDQATWLDIFKNGWWGGLSDSRWSASGAYQFNYNHYLTKYNLIQRRKNNEFNEIWIVNVDPVNNYESIMVGKNAYWINGAQIEGDCPVFKMMNVSISRPDANYECFGHATENILTQAFNATMGANYNPLNWSKNSIKIDKSNYKKLNLWQRFMLPEWQNSAKNTGLTGVGNMHYSPNSVDDYDWNNTSQNNVLSKWQEWENYPNMTDNPSTSVFSVSVYMTAALTGTTSDARRHHRWWFGLFPHIPGYTQDGYSNNWWDYFITGDFVTKIQADTKAYTYQVGAKLNNIKVKLTYHSEYTETITIRGDEGNIRFSKEGIIAIDKDGDMYAQKAGTTDLTFARDGQTIKISITVN